MRGRARERREREDCVIAESDTQCERVPEMCRGRNQDQNPMTTTDGGLYHGITRYTCLLPEMGVVQRTPLAIPGGGIRPCFGGDGLS